MSTLLDRHGPYLPPLVVGRIADTTTTLYGLSVVGVYERNPLVATLIDALGPGGGLALSNLVTIVVIVLAVEIGVALLGTIEGHGLAEADRLVLELAYLPAVVLSFGAALYNLGVIATA